MPDCERLRRMPPDVEEILKRLRAAGYAGYLVGGCVRDALMGREPKDWDICTSATPEESRSVFSEFQQNLAGMKHGTVSVIMHHEMYEITTFRTESGYSDHRHPDSVKFVRQLRDDLSRRDFTINAMAYSPEEGVVDLFGGCADLQDKVVRCVGCPSDRFGEDALRMFRALRFASVLDFAIDGDTAAAVHAQIGEAADVAMERLRTEWFKLLEGRGRIRVLQAFPEAAFLLMPELQAQEERFAQALRVMARVPASAEMQMSALLSVMLPEGDEAEAENIMRRLKCSNREVETVSVLTGTRIMDFAPVRSIVHRRWIELGSEQLRSALLLRAAAGEEHAEDCHACMALLDVLEAEGACRTLKDLKVTGGDLLKLGIPAKEIATCLQRLLLDVADGLVENRHEALVERVMQRKEGGSLGWGRE